MGITLKSAGRSMRAKTAVVTALCCAPSRAVRNSSKEAPELKLHAHVYSEKLSQEDMRWTIIRGV